MSRKQDVFIKEENEEIIERYELSMERIHSMLEENEIKEPFCSYFKENAKLFIKLQNILDKVKNPEWFQADFGELKQQNKNEYKELVPEAYECSYANPAYCVEQLGEEFGTILSFLYAENYSLIPYAYENRLYEITIHCELLIEIYNRFEDEVSLEGIKDSIYYFYSDYADVLVAKRTEEQINPSFDFAKDIIMNSDLSDLRYLFRYGEYISENEIGIAGYLNKVSADVIDKMAVTYVEGYKKGFVAAGIDLSKKKTVNIRFHLGFERMIKRAIELFAEINLEPVIYRTAISRINKSGIRKNGYTTTSVNKQYEYDHRMDETFFLDSAFLDRKVNVIKNTYENNKELAKGNAGPAVVETFGEAPFEPKNKKENAVLSTKQQELSVELASTVGRIVNEYMPRSEYSFTIIAFPLPEISEKFEEIFEETIKVNTLDQELYLKIQETLIQELNEAKFIKVKGKDGNQTDIMVSMQEIADKEKHTNFENCLADVNIPVGEVFTSPKLEGTKGILNVSEVYLNELKFVNLKLVFQDGVIKEYDCDNFDTKEENQKFIKENLLMNRETLPIGEFAIGTNTTAYVMANRYQIVYKLPILIVEKMGPHFAVGDTCYSMSEENRIFNPDGKEVTAKENSYSKLRHTDIKKAYFNLHTDITIPYDEIGEITSVHEDGTCVNIMKDGRFVLEGTQMLNEPFMAK
ncbi:MAG: aminopeptidase [Lachnospiraceae bacterium]|nr:aminopeptidase [Lachnospiraceae bacterium]